MDPKHLVQVFAHSAGGGGSISTGYPVADGRVLTAKHGLFPKGATGAIEVRWYNLEGDARKYRPASVVWKGGEGVDAAVLACKFPAEIKAAPYLIAYEAPPNWSKWMSVGFAAAGARECQEEPVPLGGQVLPLTTDPVRTGTFKLGVVFPAERAEDWLGASGSPVFVGQRILGVIASAQRPFGARRLTATATCRLLEDQKFRSAVRYVERGKALERYKSELVDVLSTSMEAAESLAAEMEMDLHGKLHGDVRFATIVVDQLVSQRLDTVLRHLSVAHRKLCERKKWSSAEVLRKTAWCALPAVCDVADVRLGDWLAKPGQLLRLPVATGTLAEIILAAADGRPARFELGSDEPQSPLRIQAPPGGGETEGPAKFETEWHNLAVRKFVVKSDARQTEDVETRIRLAADELSDLTELTGWHYYYIVEIKNLQEAPEWSSIVARLQQCYPAVVFLTLTGTDSERIRERGIRFRVMHMLADGKQEDSP